ncbi:hypothetical protein B0T16DRAFT_805 [Cercophora newfieldiana]|uniref:C2H2-type domain-containing protein n=1 Tax=Cercophora newfieldiana TaxID=92897 RepID=A0AA39YMV7_9PEZI|nr:hypothetical protein B0T16DRAFT_805 [Cercophora newfieldiana]
MQGPSSTCDLELGTANFSIPFPGGLWVGRARDSTSPGDLVPQSTTPSGVPSETPPIRSSRKPTRSTRVRKHSCSFRDCSYASFLLKDLEKHKVKHFGPNPETAFYCPNPGCGKIFGRKENGRRHAMRHCRYRST